MPAAVSVRSRLKTRRFFDEDEPTAAEEEEQLSEEERERASQARMRGATDAEADDDEL